MPPAPLPHDESVRIAALREIAILDTAPDAEFNALVRVAALALDAPISLISLVDEQRQWFKANLGLPGLTESPRDVAFCAHAILGEDLFEIPDATRDPRFSDNPAVTGAPDIRFYAGMPLRLGNGATVGTLCVIDRAPRELTDNQREILRNLGMAASHALDHWNLRRLQRLVTADLLASEDRLRAQYDTASAMLQAIDMDGRIVAVSDMWLAKLGYARADVIGRLSVDLLTARSRAQALEVEFPALRATGRRGDIALEMLRKDGAVIEVMLSASLERDEAGTPFRVQAVLEDVTRQRRAERALREERLRLANIIDATEIGTWEWNIQTGALLVNDRWLEMLGRTRAEVGPLSVRTGLDFLHPEDRPISDDLMRRHISGEVPRYDFECRFQHRDGNYVWMLSRGKVMTWTEDGAPEWMFGSIKDIAARKRDEAALRQSEAFLERAGRVAGVGCWELNLATGALHWTAETFRIHGLPPTYLPTVDDAIAFYAPEARPVIRDAVARCVATGEPWDLELPFDTADGRRIWVRAVGSAVIADGKPARLTGAFQDVNAQVARRLALQAANERVTIAAESGGIGIWDCDLARGRTVWDDRMFHLHGLAPSGEPPSVRAWARRVHPEDRGIAKRAVRAALAGKAAFDTELRLIWPDASVRHIRAAGRVSRDAPGRPVRMIGVNWDVTEHRRLAAELVLQAERQAEAALREAAVFRNSPDFHYIVSVEERDGDAAFVFETASPASLQTTGWSPEALIGRRPEDCFPARVAAAVLERFRACLASGGTISYAEVCATPSGRRDHEVSLTAIRNPATGKTARLAGILRDVTERNNMQQALNHSQKMNAIGRLASGVSHDFNNVLQSISGSLELVLDTAAPGSREHDFLSIGLRAAKRGSSLTAHLLAYARKQLLRPRDVDLRALLTDLEMLLGRTLGPHVAIRVLCDINGSSVRVDPGQLQTALLNLAINGAHAMPDGGTLTIATRLETEFAIDWVVISVADSGIGMDAATLAQAVEPFFTTKGLEGTGLGLSMVQGFVEQSGGRFRMSSVLGQGTTIELRLPASVVSAEIEPDAIKADPRRDSGMILLVDDDADVLVTTAAFLEKAGFTVRRAADANHALALLAEKTPFRAIVTDYAMPGMNGMDLIAEARQLRPDLPALIISGYMDLKETGFLAGSITRLRKPFQRDALISAIRQALEPKVPDRARRKGRTTKVNPN